MKKNGIIFFSIMFLIFTSCSGLSETSKSGEISFDVAQIAKACSSAFTESVVSRAAGSEELSKYICSLVKYDAVFSLTEGNNVIAKKSQKLTLLNFVEAADKKPDIYKNVVFDSIPIGKKVRVNIVIKVDEKSFEVNANQRRFSADDDRCRRKCCSCKTCKKKQCGCCH